MVNTTTLWYVVEMSNDNNITSRSCPCYFLSFFLSSFILFYFFHFSGLYIYFYTFLFFYFLRLLYFLYFVRLSFCYLLRVFLRFPFSFSFFIYIASFLTYYIFFFILYSFCLSIFRLFSSSCSLVSNTRFFFSLQLAGYAPITPEDA